MSSTPDVKSRIRELEELTIDDRAAIGRRTGVPFVIFPYDPTDELQIDERIDDYVQKLRARGQEVAVIDVRDLVFTLLDEEGILDGVVETERTNPDELGEGLSSVLLGGRTEDIGLLPRTISDRVADVDTGVVHRTGILYPFAGISTVLTQLENQVQTPLVVFYPATRSGKSLRFLDKTEGTYYRARMI